MKVYDLLEWVSEQDPQAEVRVRFPAHRDVHDEGEWYGLNPGPDHHPYAGDECHLEIAPEEPASFADAVYGENR